MSIIVAPEDLRSFAERCYCALGVPSDHALVLADTLVQADLWGHPSHGVMRLFWYALRMESGAIDVKTQIREDAPELAIGTMDGGNGIGQVVAQAAMQSAIRRAKKHGIGAVAVRRSGHFGTAMYFTGMAARQGCIGFLSTNASPAMAPWGGRDKQVGNNPWSWAAPAGQFPLMILDIANTAVARGKLYDAKARGADIPEGWAVDVAGQATTDPDAGIAGTILPMAGHKGYGISVIMDMLSGVLSGSGTGPDITGPYVAQRQSRVGHLALAIDIAACRPLSDFEADMERMIQRLKSAPKGAGVDEIHYPGEREALSHARLSAEGIALPDSIAADLRQGARRLGLTAPF